MRRLLTKIVQVIKNMLVRRELPWRVRRFLWRFFLSEYQQDEVKIKYRAGTSDKYVIEDMYVRDEYKFEKLGIVTDSVVIDIGAHIGTFTLRAAKIANQGGVFSYEPQLANFRILKKNIATNNLRNVKLYQAAVGATNGKNKLFKNSRNTAGHSMMHPISSEFDWVQLVSFDQIIVDNKLALIDLVKLDCEGAEYDILYNASKENLSKVRQIIMEYHHHAAHPFSDLVAYLKSHGFKIEELKEYDEFRGLALLLK